MLLIMVNFDLFVTRSLAVIEPDLRDHHPVAAPSSHLLFPSCQLFQVSEPV